MAALVHLRLPNVPAADYRDRCEDPAPTWTAAFDPHHLSLARHARDRQVAHEGDRSEQFVFQLPVGRAPLQLQHELPPARVIEDLRASVWVLGDRPGLQIALRIVFPHQTDPATDEPAAVLVRGEQYVTAGKWQRLTVRMDPALLADELVKLRARLRPMRPDETDAYVAAVVLTGQAFAPQTRWNLDDLVVDGLVPAAAPDAAPQTGAAIDFPIRFHLDRLLIDRRPVVPRVLVDHGEPVERFAALGANMVLVGPRTPVERLFALREAGLWVMAIPPEPRRTRDGRMLGMAPFGRESSPIACWYFGTRLTDRDADAVTEWIDAVRSADRQLRRPVAADVSGSVRRYTRHLSLTACTLPVVHSPTTFAEYAEWLNRQRQRALPGSFLWTWVQTDASPNRAPDVARRKPIVEPEQIRLQVYAALAAGFRGIGFWTSRPLDDANPLNEEQALTIRLLNYELELIEPFVAGGTLADVLQPQPPQSTRPATAVRLGFLTSREALKEQLIRLRLLRGDADRARRAAEQIRCGVIRSPRGLLLIPVWYEPQAQYAPGPMALRNVRFVVPGVADDAVVWQVSPTRLVTVPRRRVAGGAEITIPILDQGALLVVTADRDAVTRLRNHVAAIRADAARAMVRLATLRRQRVGETDSLLSRQGLSQPDAPQILLRADESLQRAAEAVRTAAAGGDGTRTPRAASPLFWDQASRAAAAALQTLRILQRAHWEDAVRSLANPASSPYSVCFHTLPEHARLLARLGRTPWDALDNRLPFGTFDPPQPQRMIEAGWEHRRTDDDTITSAAELIRVGATNYALRLWSVPSVNADTESRESPSVLVRTPPIPVRSGQVVVVTGKVRVVRSINGDRRGAEVTDSLAPASLAIRFHRPADWQPLQLIREAAQDTDFRLTFRLWGTGEVQFDDLAVYVLTPNDARAQTP
ncbi:MAG: hypothetical protein D6725_13220 [Planctomycetota bacterium]|nr:MAG: hypothetical protein D6725_13220 [Planctomycetota bacterium]